MTDPAPGSRAQGIFPVFCLLLTLSAQAATGPGDGNARPDAPLFAAAAKNYDPAYGAAVQSLLAGMREGPRSHAGGEPPGDPPGVQNRAGTYVPATVDPSDPFLPRGKAASRAGMPNPAAPIVLDVTLLRRTSSRCDVAPMEDGDVLRDGRGDPRAGDRFKIAFRSNCDCYVYIVAADATGRVEPVFPHAADDYRNPVSTGSVYEMPRSGWYGLDERRGVETLYFVSSRGPRQDLEATLRNLMGRPAPARPDGSYTPVTEPALVTSAAYVAQDATGCNPTRGIVRIPDCRAAATRGLVRIPGEALQDAGAGNAAMNVQTGGGATAEFQPERFMIGQAGRDLVFTRWFRHE